ncbi:MAG: D-tyrosyl-tRNA(Tyr) deacylase [Lentisphaerae bacterium]|nr:D-tyrosyl-tRNA(Tyr) deacylase [Lentisphaerota bacterium]
MRALVQRVRSAGVAVGDRDVASIGPGALVLLGVAVPDTPAEAEWLAGKVSRLRIFDDAEGRMNLSIAEAGGRLLVVSQFTLLGDCRKGNRPSYIGAAPPERAALLYEEFVRRLRDLGHDVQTGVFREMMQVRLINDGPVTILVETPPPA